MGTFYFNLKRIYFILLLTLYALAGTANEMLIADSITISATSIQPTCYGASNGSIDLSVSGGASPYNYVWSNTHTSEDLSNLPAGPYTVTVSDSGGGSAGSFDWSYTNTGSNHTIMIPAGTVTVGGLPISIGDYVGVFYATSSGMLCGGYKQWTGDATAVPAWGSEPGSNNGFAIGEILTWKVWKSVEGIAIDMQATYEPGLFADTVFMPNGMCIINALTGSSPSGSGMLSAVLEIELTGPSQIGISSVLSDYNGYSVSPNGASNGSISLSISGGNSPYLFNWAGGETTDILTGLSAGTYNVSVSDANSCSTSTEITLSEPALVIPPLVLNSQISTINCFGDCAGSIDLSLAGGSPPFSYAWSNGATSEDISGLCPGNYNVTISYTTGSTGSAPFNWTYTNTGSNHVILLQTGTITINGLPLQAGDYVGVFYDSLGTLACGGYKLWAGTTTAITAWGKQSGKNDGFAYGEPFVWKVFKAAGQIVVDMVPTYSSAFFNEGSYINNGLSGIETLTGSNTFLAQTSNITESFTLTGPDELQLNLTSSNACTLSGILGSIDLAVSGGAQAYSYLWSNGETTQDISNLVTGTYSVTVTDANTCTATGSVVIEQITPILISYLVSDYNGYNVSANGASDGWINVSASGGVGSYTYSWGNGETLEDLSNLVAGIYLLTVNDTNNCPATAIITLIESPPLPSAVSATQIKTDATCFGVCDGTIDLNVTGGTPPYSFLWSDNASLEDRTGLCAGTYSVSISDMGTSGNISSPFNWHYNNTGMNHSILIPQSAPTINGSPLQPGDYIGVFFANGNNFVCAGYKQWTGSTTAITAWGAQSTGLKIGLIIGEVFQWRVWRTSDSMTVDMSPVYQSGFANSGSYVNNGMSGLATLSGYLSQGSQNQQIILSTTIGQPSEMLIQSSVTNVLCHGESTGSIDITVMNGVLPVYYAWSNNAITQDISNLSAGFYSVTVSNANSCSTSAQFEITENPVLTISSQLSDYNGYEISAWGETDGFVDITVSGGASPYSYNWGTGESTQDLSNLTAGGYELTVTDNVGCTAYASFVLAQPAIQSVPLALTSNLTDASCAGVCDGSIDLSLTGGAPPYSFIWSDGSTGALLSNLCAGSYLVTITDSGNSLKSLIGFNWTYANTGSNHSIFIPSGAVTVDGAAIAIGDYVGVFYNNGGNSVCAGYKQWTGNNTALSAWGAQPGNSDGFALGEEFQWKVWRQSDSIVIAMDPTYNTFGFSNQQYYAPNGMSGIAALQGSALSSLGGAIVFESFTIAEPNGIVVTGMASNPGCFGSSNGAIDITTSGGSSPYAYLWSNGETGEDAQNLSAGVYMVSVSDDNGCIATAGFFISQSAQLSLNLSGNNATCFGGNNGSVAVAVSGGAAPFTFAWSNGASTSALSSLPSGQYCVTVSDANSCEGSACITISEPAEITIDLQASSPSCYGADNGSIQTTINGTNASLTFLWSNGATVQNLNTLLAGIYELSLTAGNSCFQTASATVVNPPELVQSAVVSNYSGYSVSTNGASDGSIDISVTGGAQPYSFLWGDGSTHEDLGSLSAGSYQLTVTDANLCSLNTTFNLSEPAPSDPLTASYTMDAISCYAICDGAIELSVSGGLSPYTYQWSNGETGSMLDALCAGNYGVTVFDSSIAGPEPEIFGWSYNNTGINHSILIPDNTITIDGQPIQVGDVIGVFYNTASSVACGGYSTWAGQMTAITAWGAQPGFPDGFVANEDFQWKVWRASDSLVVDMAATYDPLAPFVNQGQYANNGMSGISSLTGFLPTGNQSDSIVFAIEFSEPAEMWLNSTVQNPTCFGANNGQIEANVVNGNAPFTYTWSSGETNPAASALSEGSYSLTVSDQGGCQASASFNLTQPDQIIISSQSAHVLCKGGNTGSIDISVTGGISPYTYSWSNGESDEDAGNLIAGTYTLTLSDQNNCIATALTEITEPDELQVTGYTYDPICNGESNGMIELSTSGGLSPITYLWSNGDASAQNENLGAGIYCVTATDANGCQATDCWELIDPAHTVVDLIATDVSCNGGVDGTITSTVISGSVYQYNWSNGGVTANLSNLAAGVYYLTAINPQSCFAYADIEITEPDALSISFNKNNVSDYGLSDGSIDLTVSGGISPYTYSWSNNETSEDLTNLVAGTYSVTILDAHLCELIESIEITQPLGASFSQVELSCFGDCNAAINLAPGGGVSPYFYNWSNGESTGSLNGLCAGDYDLTIYDSNVNNPEAFNWSYSNTGTNHTIAIPVGTVLVDGQALSVGDVLGVFYYQGTELACGGYQEFDGTNTGLSAWGSQVGQDDGFQFGEPFIWKVWRVADSVIVDLNATYANILPQQGSYMINGMSSIETLTGTSQNSQYGDSLLFSFTINQPDVLTLAGLEGNITCHGQANGAIDLTISGGLSPYSIEWSNGETVENMDKLAAGTYSVTVEDANGCTNNTSFTLSQPDALSLSHQVSHVLCYGGNTGAIDLSIAGGTLPCSFVWSNGATVEDVSALGAGLYNVEVTDANSCTLSAQIEIDQPQVLGLTLSGIDPNCFGSFDGSISSTISGGIQPYNYLWADGPTLADRENLGGGTYSLVVSDVNGCQASDYESLTEPVELIVGLQQTDVSCHGFSDGAIILSISGGTAPVSILWSDGSTLSQINNLVPGQYSVTVSDANSCSFTETANISQPDLLEISFASAEVSCNGLSDGFIDITLTGGTSAYHFIWGDGTTNEDRTSIPVGNYSVLVSDAHNCLATMATVISGPDVLALSLSTDEVSCFGGSNGAITSLSSGGTAGYSYLWSNGATLPDLSGLSAGTYSLTISDTNGCNADASITIHEPQVLEIAAISTNPLCHGDQNGSVDLLGSGGVSPYSYSWSNNETEALIEGLAADEYCVTVTDFNNCLATLCVTLSEPTPLNLILINSDLSCFESNDGGIGTAVSGGTQNYSYTWSDGSTNQNIDLLAAGTYALTVSDANACVVSSETSLSQPPQVFVDAGNDLTINMGESALLEATPGFVSYVWSNTESTASIEVSDEGNYFVTVSDFMGCTGIDSVYVTVNPNITQEIILPVQWSFVSLNVIPPDPDVTVVFAEVVQNIKIIKNSTGQSWWPQFNMNHIGDMIVDEGYTVNMSTADTLYVEGLMVIPETTPVTIPILWSFIAYLRQTPANVVTMMSPIVNSINIVKDDKGHLYWPFFGINTIGDQLPGKGYQINTTSAVTLYYPPNSANTSKSEVYIPATQKYHADINTANNMTLGIPATAWGSMPEIGDEIGVFNPQGILAGAAVFTGGHTAISIWGDDVLTGTKEFFEDGNTFMIRLWNKISDTQEILEVESWIEGSDKFAGNGMAIVNKFESTVSELPETYLHQNYPNPFTHETQIGFSIPVDSKVKISLINSIGEKVADICDGQFPAGGNQLIFDGSNLPSGIYLYRMETNKKSYVQQMNILH